jgi:hypothetical protein
VLKKDIRTRDKHKFSFPWEGPFIVVDIAAPGLICWQKLMSAFSQTPGMSINCASIMHDVHDLINKDLVFLSYIAQHISLSFGLSLGRGCLTW